MIADIVLGTAYGDEGKGLVTSWLSDEDTVVIRFSGGHQAGHTVVEDGKRHVFSNLGAGTMKGAWTYWSEYCTFCPNTFVAEYNALRNLKPVIYVHPECPVITPYDILFNRQCTGNGHGSCGLGFGATWQRHEDYYKLTFRDLQYAFVWKEKYKLIKKYYEAKFMEKYHNGHFGKSAWESIDQNFVDSNFEEFVDLSRGLAKMANNDFYYTLARKQRVVFEGSQGILLDKDYGFFPHVTRSNTTMKNVNSIVEKYFNNFNIKQFNVNYVTRCYATRHGNGPLAHEGKLPYIRDNPLETNQLDKYQGEFRKGVLDARVLEYAVNCNDQFVKGNMKRNMIITCVDQMVDHKIELYVRGSYPNNPTRVHPYRIAAEVGTWTERRFDEIYLSNSDDSTTIMKA